MAVFPLLGIPREQNAAEAMSPAALPDLSILLVFGVIWIACVAILRSRKGMRPARDRIGLSGGRRFSGDTPDPGDTRDRDGRVWRDVSP